MFAAGMREERICKHFNRDESCHAAYRGPVAEQTRSAQRRRARTLGAVLLRHASLGGVRASMLRVGAYPHGLIRGGCANA